jgi:ribonuclease P protein component
VAKGAVMRNRLRRALYRAIKASDLSGLSGQAVFFVRVAPKTSLSATFLAELAPLLTNIRSKLTQTN